MPYLAKGVHVVTVNEYLTERDATEMGELYSWLGLSVGINLAAKSPSEKQEAYACDITYSTNAEIGFDYLRDNMVVRAENMVQRPLNYALVDEVDSILIDEARTPLIVSGQTSTETSQLYHMADTYVKSLEKEDYIIDVPSKTIGLSDSGIDKAESYFNLENLYDIENVALTHYIDNALRANYIMILDIDYVVSEDQEILIVDQLQVVPWKVVVILTACTKRLRLKKVYQSKKKPKHPLLLLTKTSSGCTRNFQG